MPTTVRGMVNMAWTHPANRRRRGRALARMAGWQVWKRVVGRPLSLTVYGDVRFRAHPDSTESGRFIYFGGLPDFEEMTFMRHYLLPGDGFIDGGANEGMFTLLAAALVGPQGEVHAFEPVPKYQERLRHNLADNGFDHVRVHGAALGSEAGSAPFVVRGIGSRIQTAADPWASLMTPVVRLDDALPADSFWTMAKLDVEGSELRTLQGAEALLARCEPPVLMLELADPLLARFGTSVGAIRAWLAERDYDLMIYDPAARQLVPAPDPLYPLVDALAVSRVRREWIEERLAGLAT
jgi:FkbM family methyltransferase